MEQRVRNYSSDSVGSDGVFIEESYYQGMLKSMDHRKGRVYFMCVFYLRFSLHLSSEIVARIILK